MPSSHDPCLHYSPSHHRTRHGYSKAQMCFFKILRLISSLPPTSHHHLPNSSATAAGIAIDLNLRFCSDDAGFQCNSHHRSHSDAGEASVQVGASDDGVHHDETEIEDEEDREEKGGGVRNENNHLDLLIEAARVVSGKEDREIEEARRGSEGKESWMVVRLYGDDTEERSPAVVRTKRGRSRALPYRFRDSVMEPLKRTARPLRLSSTTTPSRKRVIGT